MEDRASKNVKTDLSENNLTPQGKESKTECTLTESVSEVVNRIQFEMKTLCSKDTISVRKPISDDNLVSFSWKKVSEDLQQIAPTFWEVLQKACLNPSQTEKNKAKTDDSNLSGIASAACKLVSLYNRDMNVVQKLNSLVLLRGGAKKSAFRRFSSTHDCLSYPSTLAMADRFGANWESDLMKWVNQVDKDVTTEKQMCDRLNLLEETTILFDGPVETVQHLFETNNIQSRT